MEQNRREFLKGTAWMGLAAATAGCMGKNMKVTGGSGAPMQGYADKPMDVVRVGFVGLGSRGDVLQFLDEVVLEGVTSRGIDYDDLLVLEVLHSVLDDLGGILLSGFTVDIDAHLLAELA